jgi:hypothetical protein
VQSVEALICGGSPGQVPVHGPFGFVVTCVVGGRPGAGVKVERPMDERP